MGGREFQPELFKRWLQTPLCHLCISHQTPGWKRDFWCVHQTFRAICVVVVLCFATYFWWVVELSGGPGRFVFVAKERETFVGVVQVMDARGIACVLWLRDRSGTGPREWEQIMMDYSGQTCLCRDCSCSNRSLQTVSEVVAAAALCLRSPFALWRQTMDTRARTRTRTRTGPFPVGRTPLRSHAVPALGAYSATYVLLLAAGTMHFSRVLLCLLQCLLFAARSCCVVNGILRLIFVFLSRARVWWAMRSCFKIVSWCPWISVRSSGHFLSLFWRERMF